MTDHSVSNPSQAAAALPPGAMGTAYAALGRRQDGVDEARYARCIEVSKRVRWEIERDVIRGRRFDDDRKYLPDGLSRVNRLPFLDPAQRRLLSRIQGRTYANMFGLVERFIGAKMLELGREHGLGSQVAMEAIVRLCDEELKHQALFRRVETLIADGMAAGYRFVPEADAVATAVLAAPTWSVLALTCHIELFTQLHYRESIEPQAELSPIFKDVFLFHWKEESQHAIVDELEWRRVDATLSADAREQALHGFIGLVAAVDGLLQQQATADSAYFLAQAGASLTPPQAQQVAAVLLSAYRWQYIVSGAIDARFNEILSSLLDATQLDVLRRALQPLMD